MVETIKYRYEDFIFSVRLGIAARLFSVFIISYIYKSERMLAYSFIYSK